MGSSNVRSIGEPIAPIPQDEYFDSGWVDTRGWLDAARGDTNAFDWLMAQLGDRKLQLKHFQRKGIPLGEKDRDATLKHLERLWGYEVVMEEVEG